jgi:uncharacterized protein (DUF3820 family)
MANKLKDTDPLLWGNEHRGKALVNVPASYLLWMHDKAKHVPADIMEYIKDNLTLLKKEVKKSSNFNAR